MAKDIVMPKMGYDMTEGKLLRWIKHEGDTITKGQPGAAGGTIKQEPPSTVRAGASGRLRAQASVAPGNGHAPAAASTQTEAGRVKASPLARRLAQEYELDLSAIRGTGPGGRVTRDDVLGAAEAARTAPPAPQAAPAPAPEAVPEAVPTAAAAAGEKSL